MARGKKEGLTVELGNGELMCWMSGSEKLPQSTDNHQTLT